MSLRSPLFLIADILHDKDLNLKTVVPKPPTKTVIFVFQESDEAVDLTVERVDTPVSK